MSGLGEMGNLLKQAQEMQRQIDRARSDLRAETVVGHAGGGVVRVHLSADRHEVKRIEIAPEVLKGEDPRMLEDLVQAAVQDALRAAAETEKKTLGKITGGLQLPGLS